MDDEIKKKGAFLETKGCKEKKEKGTVLFIDKK